jgi:hypothetical protein
MIKSYICASSMIYVDPRRSTGRKNIKRKSETGVEGSRSPINNTE